MKIVNMTRKKLIMVGAGKIGRSFIGQLFSFSGFEVVFVDINNKVINELNYQNEYSVVIKGTDYEETIYVRNVRGIHLFDEDRVRDEIITADIIAISTGVQNWSSVILVLAKGIERRYEISPDSPIDIIIAENVRDGGVLMYKALYEIVNDKTILKEYVGLVETSIGKMVPIMTKDEERDDLLRIFAEPYNNLIVDKKGFKNCIPEVKGLSPKENIKAWVDRKLFIHNLGHAAVAYFGYLNNPQHTYIYEALNDPQVKSFVINTMHESAAILKEMYPDDFSSDELNEHIYNLISRFDNKNLRDTIFRVGRDLHRKLGEEDRLVAVIKAGIKRNMPTDKILLTLVSATFFRAVDQNGEVDEKDISFISIFNNGIEGILTNVCGFNKREFPDIYRKAGAWFDSLKSNKKAFII